MNPKDFLRMAGKLAGGVGLRPWQKDMYGEETSSLIKDVMAALDECEKCGGDFEKHTCTCDDCHDERLKKEAKRDVIAEAFAELSQLGYRTFRGLSRVSDLRGRLADDSGNPPTGNVVCTVDEKGLGFEVLIGSFEEGARSAAVQEVKEVFESLGCQRVEYISHESNVYTDDRDESTFLNMYAPPKELFLTLNSLYVEWYA